MSFYTFIKQSLANSKKAKGSLMIGLYVFASFLEFIFFYGKKNILVWSYWFENNKNLLVKFFIMKRGRYNRPFLHVSAMVVLGIGVLIGPFIADTYPIFASGTKTINLMTSEVKDKSVVVGEDVFATNVSKKPRDKIIIYRVEKGDTISTIATKFDISIDTIKWENGLANDDIAVGDNLNILPMTGMSHKVLKGESVYSIAKKYDTESQKIVDFPFNDFANPETFSLVEGVILIVPDGVKPVVRPTYKRQVYMVQGPIVARPGGFTFPARGAISQFASWYHMAIDIAASFGTQIVSAHNGTVTKISIGTWDGGYGTSVYINNGDGIESHYAHLNIVDVSVGQAVTGGQTRIGTIGMTGRTTGPHVHFEIRKNGTLVNPLPYVQ